MSVPAGTATSAWLVGVFEGWIPAEVRLAFFIPGVVTDDWPFRSANMTNA